MYYLEKSTLKFGRGKDNVNKDFMITSSSVDLKKEYDFLIFTDSKGISIDNEKGLDWPSLLLKDLDRKEQTYLLIIRPKEMTVFFTLLNFIEYNNIKYDYLITNVGFVDTTPKKEEFIDDIYSQCPFDTKKLKKYSLYDYILSSGEKATLYTVDYTELIADIASGHIKSFNKIYLLETFEFSPKIKIKRERPSEFYSQLKKANQLIRSVSSF